MLRLAVRYNHRLRAGLQFRSLDAGVPHLTLPIGREPLGTWLSQVPPNPVPSEGPQAEVVSGRTVPWAGSSRAVADRTKLRPLSNAMGLGNRYRAATPVRCYGLVTSRLQRPTRG
jgi:hypothetical protein